MGVQDNSGHIISFLSINQKEKGENCFLSFFYNFPFAFSLFWLIRSWFNRCYRLHGHHFPTFLFFIAASLLSSAAVNKEKRKGNVKSRVIPCLFFLFIWPLITDQLLKKKIREWSVNGQRKERKRDVSWSSPVFSLWAAI